MPTKRPSANPYPQSHDRPRRAPLRSNSDSMPLHSPPVVGQDGQQARAAFLNAPGNSSSSMLASFSLPAKVAIESQRRAQSKGTSDSRSSTCVKAIMPASSAGEHRTSSERPPSTASSNTSPAGSNTTRTYATATRTSMAKRSSPPSIRSQSNVASHVSFIPIPTTRSRAQATDAGSTPSKTHAPPSHENREGDWRIERRILERDLERTLAEKNGIAKDNESLKKRIVSYEDRLSTLERALREERRTSEALKAQVSTIQQASTIISEEANRVQKRCRDLEDKNKGLEAEVCHLKDEVREGEEQRLQLQILGDARKQELKSVQVFLATTDTCSEADVLKLVASLNAEIFQTSAYISGLVEDLSYERVEELTWQQCLNHDTFSLIEARVGRELLDFIGERGPDNRRDPFPLQLALQALLVWWSSFMVNSFCDNNMGSELATLYKHVRGKETQAVAARWRAITVENLAKFKKETYGSFVLYSIFGILRMAGCSQNLPTSKSATTIRESISVIEKIWKQIRAAVKEGVISSDIELVHEEPGARFDRGNMEDYYMEDEDLAGTATPLKPDEEPVLCPVAIGVKKSTIKSTDNPQLRSQQDVTLLKPKVVLASALAHMA